MRSEREGRSLPKSSDLTAELTHEEIANRAYQIYLQRGADEGYDVDDWLQAEQELARERAEQVLEPGVSKPEAA
jgi:hypothetical protein